MVALSKKVRFRIFERDKFTCTYCGAKPPDTVLEVDHIHPRSKGGTDTESNLTTSCWACNRGKRDRPVELEWSLIEGPPPETGPLDGQKIITDLRFPALWVYKFSDNTYVYKMDTLDSGALLENPWTIWLRGASGGYVDWNVRGKWYEEKGEYPVHCGFYLSVTPEFAERRELPWIPLHLAFEWITCIGPNAAPVRYEDDEEDETNG